MSTFFKIFPPPKFINAPYAGISISDDAVQCIQFSPSPRGRVIGKYVNKPLPPGIVEAGHIMDEPKLTAFIKEIVKELGVTFVKAALPEEKVYLFKTTVPVADTSTIAQNIEFKLEENVPIPAAEAIFCFEIIPGTTVDSKNTATVIAAPRKAVEAYLNVLTDAGLNVISFEMTAQALAKSLIEPHSARTIMIIHLMNKKASVYVVHQGVVCFSSTVQLGENAVDSVHREVNKVYDYWGLHGEGKKEIDAVIMCGASALLPHFSENILPPHASVEAADVWRNVINNPDYIPPITFEDSLEYATVSGLAL